ncbi:MAG: leucine-rich repeat domain-containing protein [Cyanobacteria bacterium P01_C01_bin.38]
MVKKKALEGNQISDLKPLSNFNKLTTLQLGDNKISDVKPLANLTNLDILTLNNN